MFKEIGNHFPLRHIKRRKDMLIYFLRAFCMTTNEAAPRFGDVWRMHSTVGFGGKTLDQAFGLSVSTRLVSLDLLCLRA
ncbi:MAG: hypothetical protein AAF950_10980 [Pseudomonadota bacterium]